jgi:hypothetical protein
VLKCYNRADDGLRTRDLQLGKLALYQLSYVRMGGYFSMPGVAKGGSEFSRMADQDTVLLFRPVGQAEMDLIESRLSRIPSKAPESTHFLSCSES